MTETTNTTTTPTPAPNQGPGPTSDAGGGTPQRRRSLAVGGGRGQDVHAPAVRSTDTDREDLPDREPVGESDTGGDESGEYAPSSGGASYASDIAMLRAEADYTSTTVMPHYELLISQARLAGNGPKTIQALQAGLEAARTSLGALQDAIAQVQATSEPVQNAYDDAGGEAAKSKTYFHGD